MSLLKSVLSKVYSVAAEFKNFLYDSNLIDHIKLKVPVLSVGNLTMGGTGKTPLTVALAQQAQRQGLKPVIVARGYGSAYHHPRRVDLAQQKTTDMYGDEAVEMQSLVGDIPVVVGNPKWKAALWAEQNLDVNLIIVDDGFQHRTLFRDFDVVLVDASKPLPELDCVPLGRAREHKDNVARADAVIYTKVNSSSESLLQSYNQALAHNKIYKSRMLIDWSGITSDESYILVAGIGNFNQFKEQVLSDLGNERVKASLQFQDHHHYNKLDALKILEVMQLNSCNKILLTNKDFVKLQQFDELKDFLLPLPLRVEWLDEPIEIYDFFNRCNS